MLSERPTGKALPSLLLITVAVVLAQFARLPQFGLWEDDHWSVSPYLNDPVSHLGQAFESTFTQWPTGRPLNHFLPQALSRIGSALGGLEGVYVLAAGWLALNGCLVFLVVRRVLSGAAALVAALAYVVFPADTTRILLVHAAHVQGAMTFLLLGLWLWTSGRAWRVLSYPVASLALLAYESAYLPFLAVPLLWSGGRRATLRIWGVHLLLCAATIGGDAAIRFSIGDVRATDAVDHPDQTVSRVLSSMVIGPATSGRSMLTSARNGVKHLDAYAVLAASLVALGLLLVLRTEPARGQPVASPPGPRWPAWLHREAPDDPSLPWWWLFLGAVVVWCGSYALTVTKFQYPPTQTMGRLTSTHVAAAWPASLALAALFEGLRGRGQVGRRLAVAAFALWLAGTVGYTHYLQREYVRAWGLAKTFWRQVMNLAPEVGPGWAVIVKGEPATGSRVILSNAWSDYHVFRLIFAPGNATGGPAFAHLGRLGEYIQFREAGGRVEWNPEFWTGEFRTLDPARLVLLHDDHGVLRRVAQVATAAGTLRADPGTAGAVREQWPDTPMARLLFPDRFP